MEIEMSMESGEWFVKGFVVEHNHPLAIVDQTTFIRSHRGLNNAQTADAIDYGTGGLQTHQIMEVMEKQHGGPEKVGFVPRDLYNFITSKRRKGLKVVMLNFC
jgi:zinc finger SWIM domain-containing protein 3